MILDLSLVAVAVLAVSAAAAVAIGAWLRGNARRGLRSAYEPVSVERTDTTVTVRPLEGGEWW